MVSSTSRIPDAPRTISVDEVAEAIYRTLEAMPIGDIRGTHSFLELLRVCVRSTYSRRHKLGDICNAWKRFLDHIGDTGFDFRNRLLYHCALPLRLDRLFPWSRLSMDAICCFPILGFDRLARFIARSRLSPISNHSFFPWSHDRCLF
jgi:hypothetical protein